MKQFLTLYLIRLLIVNMIALLIFLCIPGWSYGIFTFIILLVVTIPFALRDMIEKKIEKQ